jgi:hypothetical protein
MRDRAHYIDMLDRNPGATVGVTLAAKAILASCGWLQERWSPDSGAEQGKISRELRKLYGDTMTPDEVRTEMDHTSHWKCVASN